MKKMQSRFMFSFFGSVALHFIFVLLFFVFINNSMPKNIVPVELLATQIVLLEEFEPQKSLHVEDKTPEEIGPIKQEIAVKKPSKPKSPAIVAPKPSLSTILKTDEKEQRLVQQDFQPQEKQHEPEIKAPSTPKSEPMISLQGQNKKESAEQQISSEQSQSRVDEYLSKVRNKIQSQLHYPSQAKRVGMEGEVVVRFFICSDGMVGKSSVELAKSSGKRLLDKNALNAVLDSAPFELPPEDKMEIVVPVVFSLAS